MDTADSPAKPRLGLLPQFSPPVTPPPAETLPADPESHQPTIPVSPYPASVPSRQGVLSTPKPGRGDTPTETSSASDAIDKPTPADTTALFVGILGLVVIGAAFFVRSRTRNTRRLREPSKQQMTDVAAPLARIALRHADISWLNKDLADGLKAATAAGAYMNDGPLLEYTGADAGVPTDLQEDYS